MDIRLLCVTCASEAAARAIADAPRRLLQFDSRNGKRPSSARPYRNGADRENLVGATTPMIKSKHSYTVPCVAAIPALESGNPDYLAWLRAATA
jgi:hypothetical protein